MSRTGIIQFLYATLRESFWHELRRMLDQKQWNHISNLWTETAKMCMICRNLRLNYTHANYKMERSAHAVLSTTVRRIDKFVPIKNHHLCIPVVQSPCVCTVVHLRCVCKRETRSGTEENWSSPVPNNGCNDETSNN